MLALISRIRVEGLATTGRVDICAGVKKMEFLFSFCVFVAFSLKFSAWPIHDTLSRVQERQSKKYVVQWSCKEKN